MQPLIEKIAFIKDMAVFRDYNWDLNLKDFGDINVLYGRNYSGKTTLSRLVRALETKTLSDKYNNPSFQIVTSNGMITEKDYSQNELVVRVFNKDFIKDNLSFIIDNDNQINAFAVLGKQNTKLEKSIKDLENEIGVSEPATGLWATTKKAENNFKKAKEEYDTQEREMNQKLTGKAREIKLSQEFYKPNYNSSHLQNQIAVLKENPFSALSEIEICKLKELILEKPKDKLAKPAALQLKLSEYIQQAKALIEKKIEASQAIEELNADTNLNSWVHTGRKYHQNTRTSCAFCGNPLPEDLWKRLDLHFSKSYEELNNSIGQLVRSIKNEQNTLKDNVNIHPSLFYANLERYIAGLNSLYSKAIILYSDQLENIIEQLESKQQSIFTAFQFKPLINVKLEEPHISSVISQSDNSLEGEIVFKLNEKLLSTMSPDNILYSIQDAYAHLIDICNKKTIELNEIQDKARHNLYLNDVHNFITTYYTQASDKLVPLTSNYTTTKDERERKHEELKKKDTELLSLKAQLKDESKGVEKINSLLTHYFGHQELSLKAVADPSGENDTSPTYRFEVVREGEQAFHLSEGECSLIAFCYFIAKLEDYETKGKQPIIWIDDPISSLDANHIFFVYSIIKTQIVKKERKIVNGKEESHSRYSQLFISTHNLDFLKYLYRLLPQNKCRLLNLLFVERTKKTSILRLLPTFIQNSEFTFLFEQIYICASASNQDDENYHIFYNFGNNVRKFLELFLAFKYPQKNRNIELSLAKFFGNDDIATALTSRVDNEFSHLQGVFERSDMPIDTLIFKQVARFILKTIKDKDIEQYNAFLDGIDGKDIFINGL